MYTIKEVGQKMHVSAHTIRYWAKLGFFPFIRRSEGNIRLFDEDDLEWVKLVKCLRSAGVENNEIKCYIDLCLKGDATIPERYAIIKATRAQAYAKLKQFKEQVKLLDFKEEYYASLLRDHRQDNWNPQNHVNIDESVVERAKRAG